MPRTSKPSDLPKLDLPQPTAKRESLSGNRNGSKELDMKTGEFLPGRGKRAKDHGIIPEVKLHWIKVTGLKRAFLIAYAECGSFITACNIANVHPSSVRGWLNKDPEFLTEFDMATDNAVAMLEMEARRRALEGSDRLLEFLLKSLRPEVYRERYEIKQEIATDYIIDLSGPAPAESNQALLSDGAPEIILE
jgi:hypothetical protein